MREKRWDREVLFAKFELHLRLALINKEAVFVKLELRLRLVLDNNEVLLAKLKLRLRLAFANFTERPRFGFELRFQLALISKLSASDSGLAQDSNFAYARSCLCAFGP